MNRIPKMTNLFITILFTFSMFILFLVLPVTSQQAKQANTTENAAEHKARLVFALGKIEINAVAKDGQIDDDTEDVAYGTAGLVSLLQQQVVDHKGEGNQCGIDQIIGGFFGNHGFSI